MNPLRLLVLLVTLPLLLGGCGEKTTITTEPELEFRDGSVFFKGSGIAYLKDSDTPYTGTQINYVNGKKHNEQNYKNGMKNGLHVMWYKNGQKEDEVTYKNGKRDGLWTQRYKNGQKQVEQIWKDGTKEGLAVYWHGNGQKKVEVIWKDGKPVEGSEKFWNRKGEPVNSRAKAQ